LLCHHFVDVVQELPTDFLLDVGSSKHYLLFGPPSVYGRPYPGEDLLDSNNQMDQFVLRDVRLVGIASDLYGF
jgi:hypothetical protein